MNLFRLLNLAATCGTLVGGLYCAAAPAVARVSHATPQDIEATRQVGQGPISFYGPGFHGKRTANGERFNAQALTMAHRTLPFGTMVRVTNLRNGRSVVLRVNDRGPWARGRIADVSVAAARALGMHGHGVVRARLEVGTAATQRRR